MKMGHCWDKKHQKKQLVSLYWYNKKEYNVFQCIVHILKSAWGFMLGLFIIWRQSTVYSTVSCRDGSVLELFNVWRQSTVHSAVSCTSWINPSLQEQSSKQTVVTAQNNKGVQEGSWCYYPCWEHWIKYETIITTMY